PHYKYSFPISLSFQIQNFSFHKSVSFLSLLSPIFLSIFFECMIESGFVFTQISTTKSGSSHERTRKCKKSSKKTRVWIVFFWRFVQIGDTYIKTRRRCNIYYGEIF
ncbi:hypothetical protein LINGRAHAP2_LOCUS15544, partial [Linum grandiflorum]